MYILRHSDSDPVSRPTCQTGTPGIFTVTSTLE